MNAGRSLYIAKAQLESLKTLRLSKMQFSVLLLHGTRSKQTSVLSLEETVNSFNVCNNIVHEIAVIFKKPSSSYHKCKMSQADVEMLIDADKGTTITDDKQCKASSSPFLLILMKR